MSKCTPQTMACPSCQADQKFTVWKSVNVSLDPELKSKLMSGELTRFTCDACGHTADVVYSILYHDMEKQLMVWMVPSGEAPQDDGGFSALLAGGMAQYTRRLVASRNALVEKILIFDADLDDRVMEVFKHLLLRRMEGRHSGRVFFAGISGSEQSPVLDFVIMEDDGQKSFTIDWEDYAGIRDEVLSMLPTSEEGPWPLIDESYSSQIQV